MIEKFGEFVGMSLVALFLLGVAITVFGYGYFMWSWLFGL